MVQPNWSLLQMNGPQGGFQNALAQGYSLGTDMRQRREEGERRNALSGYITNPNEETFGALAQAAPEQAYPIMQQRQQQQREQEQAARLADLTQRAMSGDAQARQELISVNFDRWQTLDERQQETIVNQQETRGQAARYALNQPDIRAAVQNYVQTSGDQEAAALLQMDDAQLRAALETQVFQSGIVGDLISDQRPDYMAIPQGGTLVDTRNPQAVQQFGQSGGQAAPPPRQSPPSYTGTVDFSQWQRAVERYGSAEAAASVYAANGMAVAVQSPAQAQGLPEGTRYTTPDGQEFVR